MCAAFEQLLEASRDAKILILSGEPIDEPIVQYGPFVMNTEAEIRQTLADLRNGTFVKDTPRTVAAKN